MTFHQNSALAATYTEAAGEQEKYWEMQELLFERQREWGEQSEPQTVLFDRYAAELGLDVDKIKASIAQHRHAIKIERDKNDGLSLGVSRTPTLFVNGRRLMQLSLDDLKSLINEELQKAP